MRLIDADALSMKLIGEELDAYAKADFRFAQALSIFHGLISKAPTVEERKPGHWIDVDLDTSICSVCKNPQEYETRYCPKVNEVYYCVTAERIIARSFFLLPAH